ncbi:GFA family protein [Sphingomonas sp. H39-1-10]|uniref:GFA family protein n=1 Tax=Sphingomonas pollutisoli TaxID=3030829 RepID=UPI0023B8FCF3|nr:GFA family protein [Sphingomonas pollutisoli]MDF0489370.1 GFA family protein [Sphingomonas pollutisoli]
MTSGGCLCGAIRYDIPGEPIAARACWCRLCQYLGAGSGTVNVAFPSEGVTITGAPRWRTDTADSGNVLHRGFCAECGTPLFSTAEARPHLIFVRAGSLDDPGLVAPGATIWTSEAPAWAHFDPALPQVEGQPPPVA